MFYLSNQIHIFSTNLKYFLFFNNQVVKKKEITNELVSNMCDSEKPPSMGKQIYMMPMRKQNGHKVSKNKYTHR